MLALASSDTTPLCPISVAELHRMIAAGVFANGERIELIDGVLVATLRTDPRHDGTVHIVWERIRPVVPPAWEARVRLSVTLATSQPMPDLAVVRLDADEYMERHPGPADIGVVVEVSNSTLATDRADKQRIYARDGIPVYWIVNVIDDVVEVYTSPDRKGAYAHRRDYRPGENVPFDLDGDTVTTMDAADLLP